MALVGEKCQRPGQETPSGSGVASKYPTGAGELRRDNTRKTTGARKRTPVPAADGGVGEVVLAPRTEGWGAGRAGGLSGSMFRRRRLRRSMREDVQARMGRRTDQAQAKGRHWLGDRQTFGQATIWVG